jgi:hypothetical protein
VKSLLTKGLGDTTEAGQVFHSNRWLVFSAAFEGCYIMTLLGWMRKGFPTGLTIKFYATWSQLSPVSIHSTYFLQYCGARQASLSLYLHSHQILPASGPLHMLLVLLEASAYNVSTLPDFPLTLRFKF